MTFEELGTLFEAFAYYYWSVPVEYVIDKVLEWHPEVTVDQINRALVRCSKDGFEHHCMVIVDGLDEPELVVEHLYAVDDDDLDNFIAARIDGPYCECDEATLLRAEEEKFKVPEAKAIMDFGRTVLNLDDDWAWQLVLDCIMAHSNTLIEKGSWVMEVLQTERYGQIRFRTVGQVKQFRELGNRLYQVLPNPVLKGWKPTEVDNPPVLIDDIPEKDADIPDRHRQMEEIWAKLRRDGGTLEQTAPEDTPKRKIGRNDPCPCGSGKKYKKCCGR